MTTTRRRITLAVAATAMTVGLTAGTAGSASACIILPTGGSSTGLSGLISALLGGKTTTSKPSTGTTTTSTSTKPTPTKTTTSSPTKPGSSSGGTVTNT